MKEIISILEAGSARPVERTGHDTYELSWGGFVNLAGLE